MKDFGILLLSVKNHLPKRKMTHMEISEETFEQTKG